MNFLRCRPVAQAIKSTPLSLAVIGFAGGSAYGCDFSCPRTEPETAISTAKNKQLDRKEIVAGKIEMVLAAPWLSGLLPRITSRLQIRDQRV